MPCQASNKILHRLEEWKQQDGQLPDYVQLCGQLLQLQAEVKSRIPVPKPTLTKEAVNERLKKGVLLPTFKSLSLDWHLFQGLFQRMATTILEHSAVAARDAKTVRKVASNTALLQKVVEAWFDGLSLPSSGAKLVISKALLIATIQATLHPFLAPQAKALMPLVIQEEWRHGICPICGGLPDFAFLDRENGARWLLCCLCDACWLFQRMRCPYCNTEQQNGLSYLTDQEGTYRLYLCDECHSYMKAVDLRKKEGEVSLPWERIQTLELDWQAQQEGYQALAGPLSLRV